MGVHRLMPAESIFGDWIPTAPVLCFPRQYESSGSKGSGSKGSGSKGSGGKP